MGTVRKIGEEYYIEFEARGLKYQQKAGRDEASAWKLLETTEAKIRHGEMSVIVRDVDIDIFIRDFVENIQPSYPPATVRRFHSALDHFKNFLARSSADFKTLSRLTPRVIEDYKNDLLRSGRLHDRPLKPKVINLTLLLLREFFEYAIKLGYLNDNPTLHIRLLPVKSKAELHFLNEKKLKQWQEFLRNHNYEALTPDAIMRLFNSFLELPEGKGLSVSVLRNTLARDLLRRRSSFLKLCRYLGFNDVARGLIFMPVILEVNAQIS